MQLILARHGNTFAPGDKVVWVGARSDLPLVDKGLAQARAVADGLRTAGLAPSRIYAGPLKRTRTTAEIVAGAFGLGASAVVIADDLREIDYGTWEGRSNDEIRAEVGDGPIDDWQKRSVWPDGFGWLPGEAAVLAGWNRLVARIAGDNPADAIVLVVSSNGIFRLVAKALGLPAAEAKMGTGTVARLVVDGGTTTIAGWNLDPAALTGT
jgi:probable phosphoglycerate mutase